jgi:hypothetical protein
MDDIDFDNTGTTRHGFRSQFLSTFNDSTCHCRSENLVMVQALHNSIVGYKMDNDRAEPGSHHVKNTPIPDYYLLAENWVLKLRHNRLEIVDAPWRKQTEQDDYVWSFEDCAVCRRTLKDGTVVDQVQGCVRFDFIRYLDGTAELSPGKTTFTTASAAPTNLWEKALKNWRDWTNN